MEARRRTGSRFPPNRRRGASMDMMTDRVIEHVGLSYINSLLYKVYWLPKASDTASMRSHDHCCLLE